MPNLGVPELAIILVIIVIIFGVGKLPEIGGALGKGIREFKTESTTEEDEAREAEQARIDAGTSTTASTLTTGTSKTGEKVPTSVGSRADEI